MSSSAPCAPSNSSDSPRARACCSSPATSATIGRISPASASSSSRVRANGTGSHLVVVHEHEVVQFEQRFELAREQVRVEQVLHAQRAARDLVLVGRPDAAAGGADLVHAHRVLARLVERDVDRQHQRTRRRDLESRAHVDAGGLEFADFRQQRRRREHDAVADVDGHARVQRAGGDEPQDCLLAADHQRVAGIVPALEADDAGRALGQPVDDLALAFIAPLGADDDDVLAHVRSCQELAD